MTAPTIPLTAAPKLAPLPTSLDLSGLTPAAALAVQSFVDGLLAIQESRFGMLGLSVTFVAGQVSRTAWRQESTTPLAANGASK